MKKFIVALVLMTFTVFGIVSCSCDSKEGCKKENKEACASDCKKECCSAEEKKECKKKCDHTEGLDCAAKCEGKSKEECKKACPKGEATDSTEVTPLEVTEDETEDETAH